MNLRALNRPDFKKRPRSLSHAGSLSDSTAEPNPPAPGIPLNLDLSAPVQIFDLEIGKGTPSLEASARPDGTRYKQGLALVRLYGRPMGTVEVDLSSGYVDGPALGELVRKQLRSEIPADPWEERDETGPLPFFSVVVPTRNRAQSLERCLDSLIDLDYPGFEILVVDNAPSDNSTAEAVSRRSFRRPWVRYILEETPGTSQARNRGAAEARADFVAFADDDVVVDRSWLRALARGFHAADNVGCVTGLVLPAELETPAQHWFEQFGGFSKGYVRKIFNRETSTQDDPLLHPYNPAAFGTGASMAFRAETLRQLGGFDRALGGGTPAQGGEDLDSFLRVILAGHELVYEPRAVAWHYHRRTYNELVAHVRSYGTGLGAFITKLLLDPSTRFDVIRRVPYGIAVLLYPGSPKNLKKSGSFPTRLSLAELAGILFGPLAYLGSRRKTRQLVGRRQSPAYSCFQEQAPSRARQEAKDPNGATHESGKAS